MRKHTKKRHYKDAILFCWPTGGDFLYRSRLDNEISKWCDENLLDDFTCGDAGVYIYEEEDAMAYKLRWL